MKPEKSTEEESAGKVAINMRAIKQIHIPLEQEDAPFGDAPLRKNRRRASRWRPERSEPALSVQNIKKHFGGVIALDGCTLAVEESKITALIGPNGSGKSTLFQVISQLIEKDSGSITLNGHPLPHQDYQVARQGISRTFQEVRLFRNLTIKDHLELAMNEKDELLLPSLSGTTLSKEKQMKEILELVHLSKPLNTLATELSYGQRKLLDLAMAIARPHTILMLDEPVAGVNPQLRQEIKQILKNLNKQNGEALLLIEHDMNFVMNLADYVYVLNNGKVIAEGKPKDIQMNKKVLEAYLGE